MKKNTIKKALIGAGALVAVNGVVAQSATSTGEVKEAIVISVNQQNHETIVSEIESGREIKLIPTQAQLAIGEHVSIILKGNSGLGEVASVNGNGLKKGVAFYHS